MRQRGLNLTLWCNIWQTYPLSPTLPHEWGEGATSAAFRHGAPLPKPPPLREGVISLYLDGSEANLTASDGGTKGTTSLSLDGRGIEGEGAIYKSLSAEASAVRLAGQVLWQAYFAHTDVPNEFKLNRPDVGWYQIRNALKARNVSGDFTPVSFAEFEAAYKTLGDKRFKLVNAGFANSYCTHFNSLMRFV